MPPLILLFVVASIAGALGAWWWLWQDARNQTRAAEDAAHRFRERLAELVAGNVAEPIDLDALGEEYGVDPTMEAAILYREKVRLALDDNVVTDEEKRALHRLSVALDLDAETRSEIHRTEMRAAQERVRWLREFEAAAAQVQPTDHRKEDERRRAAERESGPELACGNAGATAVVPAGLALVWPGAGSGISSWAINDAWNLNVVGESHYQGALLKLVGGKKSRGGSKQLTEAVLEAEPDNPHDRNAVVVHIRGSKVGYLSREDAKRWRKEQVAGVIPVGAVEVPALINGGWRRGSGDEGHFGVLLDFCFETNRRAVRNALKARPSLSSMVSHVASHPATGTIVNKVLTEAGKAGQALLAKSVSELLEVSLRPKRGRARKGSRAKAGRWRL